MKNYLNLLNSISKGMLVFSILTAMGYLVFSFNYLSFNPHNWTFQARTVFAGCDIGAILIGTIVGFCTHNDVK